ncbi:MAG TPA: glycosyltransferase family 4 protein [Thermoanaerobaculia bacterium]|nr:glycosyltransferase family 4 protein [Thermoanaerobaculia bacterium]
MRIAFVTRDSPTENDGGLASFLNRLTRVLADLGHEVELFVRSEKTNELQVLELYGIRVERVPSLQGWPIDFATWLERRSPALRFVELAYELAGARDLARRLEARHAERPFDAVHCSVWGATALFVRKLTGRPLVTLFCWPRDLLSELEEHPPSLETRLLTRLERRAAARSDLVYAHSRYIADHLRQNHGIPAMLIRPPAFLERAAISRLEGIPPRYLIHYGGIGPPKGSDLLARALLLAWESEPELTMVWAGKEHRGEPLIRQYRELWGERARRVIWLGEVRKTSMYELVSRAVATVIPTRCDNLPNTAIESLLFGVPVIGSDGASIDEVVEPGLNGELVAIGDVEALSDAMVKAWRGEMPFVALPSSFESMLPLTAASNLLAVLRGEEPPPIDSGSRAKPSPEQFRYVPNLPAPSMKTVHPVSARAGAGFNVQPDGSSAISVECESAGMFTTIVFGDTPLRTTFGTSSFLTALVPAALIARPGIVRIQLRDEMSGDSNTIEFPIDA